jgi:hypothetical protein
VERRATVFPRIKDPGLLFKFAKIFNFFKVLDFHSNRRTFEIFDRYSKFFNYLLVLKRSLGYILSLDIKIFSLQLLFSEKIMIFYKNMSTFN